MIITNLRVSSRISGILKACAIPLYDQLNEMSVRDVKRYTLDHLGGLKAFVEVSISRHRNGSIKKLTGQLRERSDYFEDKNRSEDDTLSSDGFTCEMPFFRSSREAAAGIGLSLVKLLIAEEVKRRYSMGPRELALMSDACLSELDTCLRNRRPVFDNYDGASISEALLAAIVKREIKVRKTESAHERIDCIARHSKAFDAAAEKIEQERHRASRLGERELWLSSFGIRENLSDDERAILSLRRHQLPSLVS